MAEDSLFTTARRPVYLLGSAALVVAALYWGQPVGFARELTLPDKGVT
jgi:hypothetical protein